MSSLPHARSSGVSKRARGALIIKTDGRGLLKENVILITAKSRGFSILQVLYITSLVAVGDIGNV